MNFYEKTLMGILLLGVFMWALKAITFGSTFSFFKWFKYGVSYMRWYQYRETYEDRAVRGIKNTRATDKRAPTSTKHGH